MNARRRRHTAGETRRAILDAARRRLAEGGPEALRLQEIARDVGISHPAVLHHFGSRDGLSQALAEDAQDRLARAVLAALPRLDEAPPVRELLEGIFETWGDSGHARLFAWRAQQLEAPLPEHSEQAMLAALIDAIHAQREGVAERQGLPAPAREESAFLVRLVAVALLGDATAGRVFDLRARLDGQRDPERRFRAWVADLLAEHIARGGSMAAAPRPPKKRRTAKGTKTAKETRTHRGRR